MENKIFIFVFVFFMVLFASCGQKSESENTQKEINRNTAVSYVKTAPVLHPDDEQTLGGIGVVINKTESKPSFKTGGIIAQVLFNEGDIVRAGQVLATLQMDEINAQAEIARESLTKAIRDYERLQLLQKDSVATLEQVQNATTARAVAQQNLDMVLFNQKNSEVRAPITGKVLRKLVQPGEITGPGVPVCVIMGSSGKDWRFKSGLPENEWSIIKKGSTADIRLDAYPGEVFPAVVSDKALVAGLGSGTIDLELTFQKQPSDLAAGMIGKAEFHIMSRQDPLPVIPLEALVHTDGYEAFVYSIKDGRAVKIPVKIYRILGDQVTIASGLEGVEQVVTIGAVYLEDGEPVEIAVN